MSPSRSPDSMSEERVTVESLAYGGDSVARVGGKVAFIPFGAPGDVLRLRAVEQHKSFLRAEIARVERAGDVRRTPLCPLFEVCGGCQWQHVDHTAQVAAKRTILERALGRVRPRSVRFVAVAPEFGYRRRLRGHWRVTRGRVTLGLYRPGSQELVDVEHCLLVDSQLAAAWRRLRETLAAVADGSGSVVLLANHRGQVHLSLRVVRGQVASLDALLRDPIVGVAVSSAGDGPFIQRGETDIELDSRGLRASAVSFAQANAAGDRVLRAELSRLVPPACRSVLELHAGMGNLTEVLAEGERRVVAVEAYAPSVSLLRRNVGRWDGKVEVVFSDARAALHKLARQRAFDLVLLDPPREGARELVDPILALAPPHLMYISCDPMTLARDLERLCAGGYTAVEAVGLDMMPQTFHFESIVLLMRTADAR